MNDLVDIAGKLIDHLKGATELSGDEFDRLYHEFESVLQKTTDTASIRDVVSLESEAWLLPFELIKRLYMRAEDIGAVDDNLVMWYASRLMFYGEPSDESSAQKLLSRYGLTLPR